MRELGQQNFYIELLEECNKDISNIRENYYINLYPNNCNVNYNFPINKEQLSEDLKKYSLREIADKYGIKEKATVRYWAIKWKLNTSIERYKVCQELTKNKLYEEYIINNKSIRQLCEEYKIKSPTTIKQRIKKYGFSKLTINESNSVEALASNVEGNTELSSKEKV